jgi:aspartate-semialdehyde dehydrogenase
MVHLLSRHPWFELVALAASPAKAGRTYAEAIDAWYVPGPLPENVASTILSKPEPEALSSYGVELVFSALPSDAADLELKLVEHGLPVVSNSSPYRLEPDVPLINAEVNYEHLKPLITLQRRRRSWKAPLVKNPNCTTTIVTLALKPLDDTYGVSRVVAVSMQAASGAGLRGVTALQLLDNLIPYIPGEEEKIVKESRKIMGRVSSSGVEPHPMGVSAIATRVPVVDGHTIALHVELSREPSSVDEVVEVLEAFKSRPQELDLPTAPKTPIVVRREVDRPQPRLDRMAGNGMSIVVGRVDRSSLGRRWLRMVVLGHNLVRGAAGAALLAAELYLAEEGIVPVRRG